MIQQSEVVSLLMAVALAAVMYASVRRIEFAGRAALGAGLAALLGAYFFTVVEGFALFEVFNLLEHVSLAASGLCFAVGLVQLARSERGAEARS